MRVILTEDVISLGTIGDIVNVKDGYARNFLIPRAKAVVANEGNRKELEHHQRVLEKRKAKVLGEMKTRASAIEKITLTVAKPVGEEERIFGSVTTAELEGLLDQQGVKISRKDIHILEDVKKVGVYEAEVKLHSEVSARFKFWVVAESTGE